MRLIDADAFEVVTAQGVSMDFADGMQYVLEMLDNASTIEAEPVRHARYIPDMNYRTLGNCGLCGGDVTCIQNYCPNCGAKMRGTTDE